MEVLMMKITNELFADIFNNLMFKDMPDLHLDPEYLQDISKEGLVEHSDGVLDMSDDVVYKVHTGKKNNCQFALKCIGNHKENEEEDSMPLPILAMGYASAAYNYQLWERESKKQEVGAEALGDYKLLPLIPIFLYFDEEGYKGPTNLKQLYPKEFAKVVNDVKAHVFDVTELPMELREKLI